MTKRCKWCNEENLLYVKYHDKEWGRFRVDDDYLFEMLFLESFQAGLSWECVLNKRENFRKAFDDFDCRAIANYNEQRVQELLNNKNIIRNKRKVLASINNAKIFQEIVQEYGSFYDYLKKFTKGKTLQETSKDTNDWSNKISDDLYKRGMRFVGSKIIYSFLQAVGIIDSHESDCDMYKGK